MNRDLRNGFVGEREKGEEMMAEDLAPPALISRRGTGEGHLKIGVVDLSGGVLNRDEQGNESRL